MNPSGLRFIPIIIALTFKTLGARRIGAELKPAGLESAERQAVGIRGCRGDPAAPRTLGRGGSRCPRDL